MRPGTKIELHGTPAISGFPAVSPEIAIIVRWNVRINGPRETMPGWHIVRFAGGDKSCIHETRFRVIDNR